MAIESSKVLTSKPVSPLLFRPFYHFNSWLHPGPPLDRGTQMFRMQLPIVVIWAEVLQVFQVLRDRCLIQYRQMLPQNAQNGLEGFKSLQMLQII
jgi:hypothetical protein